VGVVSAATYHESVHVDPTRVSLSHRLWRPPSRIVLAAWTGVLALALSSFALSLPSPLAWAVGIVLGGAVFAYPLPADRRAPIEIAVEPGIVVVEQGSRRMRIPLQSVRSARVLVPAGEPRHTHGWGLSWGHAGRRVWDLPKPGLGVVRIERDHRSLDVDIASERPDRLVDAIHAAAVTAS
jgi:hypothetical protein